MTISDRLLDKIHALTAIDKSGGVYKVEDEFDGVRLQVELEAFDRLGLMVCRIEAMQLDNPTEATVPERLLRRQAQAVTETITYLNEDLKVVEVDATSNAVQLRSERPHAAGDNLSYFEFILRGGTQASLRRYFRNKAGDSTEPVSMNLSKEVFTRLINDMAGLF